MENYTVGEIIWAKIRGYPWWPAMITGIVDENKEKKFIVGFIGDNTHSILPKSKLAKFQKEYKNYSNTKKRPLLESIRLAKEMLENKSKLEEFKNKKHPAEEKSLNTTAPNKEANNNNFNNINKSSKNKSDSESQSGDEESEEEIEEKTQSKKRNLKNAKSSNNQKESKEDNNFTKSKRKRADEKKESNTEVQDLMKRIINYLLYVSKNIESFQIDNNKELLIKVFEYLKDYKLNNPIDFLKKTSLGIMIKYINSKVDDKDIQEYTNLVYRNFEEQVLDQLFKNTK